MHDLAHSRVNSMVDAYPGGSVINTLVPSRYGSLYILFVIPSISLMLWFSERGRLLFYEKDVTEVQNKLDTLADLDELEAYRQERRIFVKEMEMVGILSSYSISLVSIYLGSESVRSLGGFSG